MSGKDAGKAYDVTIVADGVNVTKSVSETTALAIIQLLMGGGGTPASDHRESSATSRPAAKASKARAQVRDFIDNSGAKSISAQIVAIGKFLEQSEDMDEFTKDDIEPRFKPAGLPPPKNLNRDIRAAIGKGWIGEDSKSPGRLFVTTKGEAAFDKKFEGSRASSSRAPRKKAKKKQAKTAK
jgi:hypothetical protein